MLATTERELLLKAARYSIASKLDETMQQDFLKAVEQVIPDLFNEERATFVTLKINNQLRGCIGNLEANSSLIDSVLRNARSAAFNDPRFPVLTQTEFEKVVISISMLTPASTIDFKDETDLLKKLRPNKDGLIIQTGHKRATFLPTVWENLPKAEQFLEHLKQKARITHHETVDKAWRYESESFGE